MDRMTSVAVCLGSFIVTGIAAAQSTLIPLGSLGGNYSEAHAVSADGSTVVGEFQRLGEGTRAFRWTLADGMVSLGQLPSGSPQSIATAVSSDGRIVVGYSYSNGPPIGYRGFRWTPTQGLQPLGLILNGETDSFAYAIDSGREEPYGASGRYAVRFGPNQPSVLATGVYDRSGAFAVSGDGDTVVGNYGAPGNGVACRWIGFPFENPLEELGRLPGDCISSARAVNANGNVVVGWSYRSNFCAGEQQKRAFRWTPQGGIQLIPELDQSGESESLAVSGDGTIVAGHSGCGAFIWTAEHGTMRVADVFESAGIDTRGWTFWSANAMTPDGLTFVGRGTHLGESQAWYAHVPFVRPLECPADWNQSGTLDSQDFFDYLVDFFNDRGDFNRCQSTNSQDFFDFLAAFFTGC